MTEQCRIYLRMLDMTGDYISMREAVKEVVGKWW